MQYHTEYKKVLVPGFGCGAFSNISIRPKVQKIWNDLFLEFKNKYTSFEMISANEASKKSGWLFEDYNKLNCFTEKWQKEIGPVSETLFINNGDPHSLPGNGNSIDYSVDGAFGRNAPISIIGCAGINENLLKPKNYIPI